MFPPPQQASQLVQSMVLQPAQRGNLWSREPVSLRLGWSSTAQPKRRPVHLGRAEKQPEASVSRSHPNLLVTRPRLLKVPLAVD